MGNDYGEVALELLKGLKALKAGRPETLDKFSEFTQVVYTDGAITAKMKELIALAIGITVRCDGCIAHHARAAYNAKASRGEVLETIGVAIQMGGGPSMVYGAEALKAFDCFADEDT